MAASVVHLGRFLHCNLGEQAYRIQVQTGSQGFYLPYSPEKFSKYRCENIYFVIRKKYSEFLFFLKLLSAGIHFFKAWLKRSQREYIFSFSILMCHVIVQTNRKNELFFKANILTNKAPLVLIFFRGLHITWITYYNLSIKEENYQLD